MYKHSFITILLIVFMSMTGANALAYDIAVENADGFIIYYNYIDEGTNLEVAQCTFNQNHYKGDLVIPEKVVYMNKSYTVKSIGNSAFWNCTELKSVKIPNSITSFESGAFDNCI